MADWRNYLEENYDGKATLGKLNSLGNKIRKKEIREDISTAQKIVTEIEKMYKEYEESEKQKKYLVDETVLVCSKATVDSCELLDGTRVCLSSAFHETERDKVGRQKTVLHIKREDSNMLIRNSMNATVLDCKKGELDELDAKSEEGRDSFTANVYPFRCNCKETVDRVEEQEIIKANLNECAQNGMCQCLMRLNDKWENMPLDVGDFYEKRKVIKKTTDGQERVVFRKEDMLSYFAKLGMKQEGAEPFKTDLAKELLPELRNNLFNFCLHGEDETLYMQIDTYNMKIYIYDKWDKRLSE